MLAISQTSAKGQISTAWNQSMKLHNTPSAIGSAKQRPVFYISKETQPEIFQNTASKVFSSVATQYSSTWQGLLELVQFCFLSQKQVTANPSLSALFNSVQLLTRTQER